MKSISWGLIALLLLQGCVSGQNLMATRKLERLTAGMSRDKVLKIAGPPDKKYVLDDQRFVFYYRTKGSEQDSEDLSQNYTAVSFEEGRLITIGQDLRDFWEPASNKTEVPPDKLLAAQRKAKIKALEAMVQPIPVSETEKNLKLYKKLLELAPENPRYRRKVKFYQSRLKPATKSAKVLPKETFDAQAAPASTNQEDEQNVENNIAEDETAFAEQNSAEVEIEAVKVRDKTYFIWIRNQGEQSIGLSSEVFSVLDNQKRLIPFNLSSDLVIQLPSGATATGELICHGDLEPYMLLFNNEEDGSVIKMLY